VLYRVWRLLPIPVRHAVRRARLALWRLTEAVPAARRLFPSAHAGVVGSGSFEDIGGEFLGHFRELGGLTSTDRVLDVGCGTGRMALPLTTFITEGSYSGFDVVAPAVKHCERHIGTGFPNFRFDHVDVLNRVYNPKGRIRPSEFRFPYDDGKFDFAFATSVFTHMLPADVEGYLREVTRVLRPGGRSLITWFIVPAGHNGAIGSGALTFERGSKGFWAVDHNDPEASLAYEEDSVREFYERAGLAVRDPIHRGSWRGTPGTSMQDIVVATKPEPALEAIRQ
jgi:SAM-dependent methyltransferase